MASIQARVSRGKKYWSIVESRRINGKPRTVILEYLGTATTLLNRLNNESSLTLKSYSHGDTHALLEAALELDVATIINEQISDHNKSKVQSRDGVSVGATLVLAAIGRACQPTSKMGWYEWSKTTTLEYSLRTSFKKLDSQHFWDQMNALLIEKIPLIEEALAAKLIDLYDVKLDCLLFDMTNFFTFIDSTNDRCELPQRGKNKQKRYDLRQIGMALLVSREEQFPLFHYIYAGNENDATVFKNTFDNFISRLKKISKDISKITLVFDKGNNSKGNFKLMDETEDLHYVGGLVSSHFKDLIKEANKKLSKLKINDEEIPAYRCEKEIWGKKRVCIVTVSERLRDGQIRGIEKSLEKRCKTLESLKQRIENPKRKKELSSDTLDCEIKKITKGQFVDSILKYEIISLENSDISFTYKIDQERFNYLKENFLGRTILVSNRKEWTSEAIILAYRGQSKVEYAFRNLKNPIHMAARPQYHWTDQKIKVHFLICIIGYLLSVAVYTKAKQQASYDRNISHLLDDLRTIRLSAVTRTKGSKVNYQIEKIPPELVKLCKVLNINDSTVRVKKRRFQ